MYKMYKLLLLIVLLQVFLFENGNTYRHRGKSGRNKKPKVEGRRVMMPSGKTFFVSTPTLAKNEASRFKCGADASNSTLLFLDPDNGIGVKEYNIVKMEVEKDKTPVVNIMKIEKIINPCLWNRYSFQRRTIQSEVGKSNMTERFLFHGSKSASDIINKGFDERYARQTGLFGAGLYFASNFTKSNNYIRTAANVQRVMLVCRVALGNMYVVKAFQPFTSPPMGYHSVVGDLTYPEYMVYRGEQAYPEFIVTYTSS